MYLLTKHLRCLWIFLMYSYVTLQQPCKGKECFMYKFLKWYRCEPSWTFHYCPSLNLNQHQDLRVRYKWAITAISKKKVSESLVQDGFNEEEIAKKKTPRTPRRTTKKTRKKTSDDTPNLKSELVSSVNETEVEESIVNASVEDFKTTSRVSRSKGKCWTISKLLSSIYAHSVAPFSLFIHFYIL